MAVINMVLLVLTEWGSEQRHVVAARTRLEQYCTPLSLRKRFEHNDELRNQFGQAYVAARHRPQPTRESRTLL